MMFIARSFAAATSLLLALAAGPAAAQSTAWDDIRQELFGAEREILPGDGIIADALRRLDYLELQPGTPLIRFLTVHLRGACASSMHTRCDSP